MLKVKVTPKTYTFEMNGHSGYSERGTDIVCSAASMLLYTLVESAGRLPEEAYTKAPEFKINDLDDVNASFTCTPSDVYASTVSVICQTILAGYELLADTYPDNVSIEIVD